tara:strand:+ start:1013 stop:1348 length:336 start_codon:yes stop_codon:yes gene_type:complete
MNRRTFALPAIIIPLLLVFAWAAFRTGPLAPVDVTVGQVKEHAIAPAKSGIGTTEARFPHKIDPTASGTTVIAGQAVGEIVEPMQLWINTRFDQTQSGVVPRQHSIDRLAA